MFTTEFRRNPIFSVDPRLSTCHIPTPGCYHQLPFVQAMVKLLSVFNLDVYTKKVDPEFPGLNLCKLCVYIFMYCWLPWIENQSPIFRQINNDPYAYVYICIEYINHILDYPSSDDFIALYWVISPSNGDLFSHEPSGENILGPGPADLSSLPR